MLPGIERIIVKNNNLLGGTFKLISEPPEETVVSEK